VLKFPQTERKLKKFKYTTLSLNNQKLEGVLEADSIELAREELHKMNLSVVAINEVTAEEAAKAESQEVTDTKKKEGITTYYFIAKDFQGKEVNGTIDSKDPYLAFRRLLTEYQFEIVDLYPSGAVSPETESLKGKFTEWKETMEGEGIDTTRRVSSGTKGELSEDDNSANKAISEELDRFIINAKKILGDHHDQYSEPFFREVEKTLNELERVRASNNLKHITKICNTLYELIANPDAATADIETDEDYKKTLSALKGSGFISNRLNFMKLHSLQKKSARFEKAQLAIARLYKDLSKKKSEEIERGFMARLKGKRAHWMNQLTRNLKGSGEATRTTLFTVIAKLYNYLTAPNPILRSARRSDLRKSFEKWRIDRKKPKEAPKADSAAQSGAPSAPGAPAPKAAGSQPENEIPGDEKRDFSSFFTEVDSFVGWLLFFYIGYFFLADFAIEKNVGLPEELVIKTLVSPLIVNICIFLVFAHLILTLKTKYFRANFLGSLFLFFLGFGIYTLLIVNF